MKSNLSVLYILFFVIFLMGCQNTVEEVNEKSNIESKNVDKEEKNYSEEIGKTLCNATNDICSGKIIEVRVCTNDNNQLCYVADRGEDYSRPVERPVSNSYAK